MGEWSWRYVPSSFFSKSDCLKAALLYLMEIVVFVILGCAPAERAGIASATMNALRQVGMTLGIAVLGSLMSLYAIQQMAGAVNVGTMQDAVELARQAIVSDELPSGHERLLSTYRDAMASGFGLAMLCAGLLSLQAAGLLMLMSAVKQPNPPQALKYAHSQLNHRRGEHLILSIGDVLKEGTFLARYRWLLGAPSKKSAEKHQFYLHSFWIRYSLRLLVHTSFRKGSDVPNRRFHARR